jgi:molybdopterin synthase sulfur carrier subunit
MKTLNIEYFAILREQAGTSSESVSSKADTTADLFAELSKKHGFSSADNFKVAVNDEFSSWDAALSDGDRVVFIPPVAGG